MRVLILSVTAGFGHHATAKAIGDMLESKGAEVHTLDVYAYISNLIKTTIDKGYLFSSKHMQTLYRLVYQLAENNGASYFNSAPSIINIINALGASKFAKVIANHVPDVIICTHVFAAHYQGNCRIYPYGFVHNVEVMMSASDCIVSKPGGLTVSEALAKNLPMLLFDPIPGHEERNVDFLVNNGMAALITKHFPIDEAVYELFCNPVRLGTVRRTMSEIAHPDATERLAEFVLRKR